MSAAPPVLGAQVRGDGTCFGVYCTTAGSCAVRLLKGEGQPVATCELTARGDGYFAAELAGVGPGALYKFVLDGRELPDPYARFLPHGVHGPALVVGPGYRFQHAGVARPLAEHVIYELHIGTFTEAGTYAAAQQRLPALAALGITAIELMPLSAFPGQRGWGYDGVAHFAPFAPYGTPDELRQLIDAAHGLGLAVFLDVVYNHFGPSGNYLASYSPAYFAPEIRNAWGAAPDFRQPVMRRYVLDNAQYWLGEFGFDGLRLDATHAMIDLSPRHILGELAEVVAQRFPAPRKLLFAEDDRNEPALVAELGLDAQWADDFHHTVRVTLTGEQDGYYAAYPPGAASIAETIRGGWFYRGQPFPTHPDRKPRGKPAAALPAEAFVYCIQNHDQIGNRALGERLCSSAPLAAYQLASAILLFLPMTPLLFMGQEWAASSPFQFFTDHDAELGPHISKGRREEFKGFAAFADPRLLDQIPDPQAAETFTRSRLRWAERELEPHRSTLALYTELLRLRRTDPVLRAAGRANLAVEVHAEVLVIRRWLGSEERVLLANFALAPVPLAKLVGAVDAPLHALRPLLRTGAAAEAADTLAGYEALLLSSTDR